MPAPQDRDDLRKAPDEGIYIHGLTLDGARWDVVHGVLVDSEPKVLHAPLPVVHMNAVLRGTHKTQGETFRCPLYKTPRRTGLNFITALNLRTGEPPSKWVLRGVCLLCSE